MLEETSAGVREHAVLARRIEGLLRRLDREVVALASVDNETFEENIGIAERVTLNAFTGPKRQIM
jgi:hypothetical protein